MFKGEVVVVVVLIRFNEVEFLNLILGEKNIFISMNYVLIVGWGSFFYFNKEIIVEKVIN